MVFYNVIAFIIVLGVLQKLYIKLVIRYNRSSKCLVGKTAIVTGSNIGIGFQTAQDFAMRGARVILACRDREKAEQAKKKIVEATDNPNVVVKIIDMASLRSVRQFAKEINETEDRLDILVNNAGAGYLGNKLSEDGLQLTMQVNHFSGFLLTNLLIDLLKKTPKSRIVNVASMACFMGSIGPNNLNAYPEDSFMPELKIYSNTKLANLLFTSELARRVKGTEIITNCLHPGAVDTGLFRAVPSLAQKMTTFGAYCFFLTPVEGAQTTIYLALSNEIEGVSGKYFDNCKKQWIVPRQALDKDLAKRLWEKSEELVKLRPEEKRL